MPALGLSADLTDRQLQLDVKPNASQAFSNANSRKPLGTVGRRVAPTESETLIAARGYHAPAS